MNYTGKIWVNASPETGGLKHPTQCAKCTRRLNPGDYGVRTDEKGNGQWRTFCSACASIHDLSRSQMPSWVRERLDYDLSGKAPPYDAGDETGRQEDRPSSDRRVADAVESAFAPRWQASPPQQREAQRPQPRTVAQPIVMPGVAIGCPHCGGRFTLLIEVLNQN